MRMASTAALAVGVLTLTASLSGCGGASSWGSCYLEMLCIEYTGAGWDGESITERCNGYGGEYRAEGCPLEDLVGQCTRDRGEEREYVEFFYSPWFTGVQGSSDCEDEGGVWKPNG